MFDALIYSLEFLITDLLLAALICRLACLILHLAAAIFEIFCVACVCDAKAALCLAANLLDMNNLIRRAFN